MAANDPSREVTDLKAQIGLLARLVEVSVTLSSTLKLEQLLDFIIKAAAELLNSEVASILLYDEQLNELRFVAATGSDTAELAKIPVPLEGSVAGTIFRTSRPVVINEVAKDSRHFRQVGQKTNFRSETLVGVPMRIKDRTTGVLEALNKRGGKGFSEADVRIFGVIASQAAVAIENARLIDELQKAYSDLGKLDKMKGDFIAIASHELRTPLGVIIGYATFLRDDLQGQTKEYADAVLDASMRMRKLIEDMSNLSFMQAGQSSLNRALLDLRHVLPEARQTAQPLADAKGQKIVIQPGDGALMVNADRPALQVVLSNLLTNAIQFTQDGGLIEINAFRKDTEAWIQIKDNGRGISPRDLERIFDGFFQAEDHMTRKTGGLGVGLAIVRGTIKGHGGRVWAESQGEGQGSTFTVTLPLADHESPVQASAPAPAPAAARRASVLARATGKVK